MGDSSEQSADLCYCYSVFFEAESTVYCGGSRGDCFESVRILELDQYMLIRWLKL